MEEQTGEGALSDLQVVDLSQDVGGAFCTKLLAGLGARVIKIEPPGGDSLRRRGPFPDGRPDLEASGLFQHLNTGKQSVTLDVTSESGAELLRRLLAQADALVESFPPGSMDGWGLGHETLHQTLPQLVYTSVTPFGQTGPYRAYRADSAAVQALCSYAYTSGDPDREPLVTACDLAEYFAGAHAFTATLAALAHREVTARGSYVDVSMLESLAMADDYNYACYIAAGAIRRRYYSQVMTLYPNEILPCKDGYVFAVGGSGGFPQGMALLIERPELADHVLFKSATERALRWRELNAFLLPWLREHSAAEIVARAQELRMPFALVGTAAGLIEDGHLRERDYFREIQPSGGQPLRLPGPPFKLSETPLEFGEPPRLGEHTAAVLEDELGLVAAELEGLFRRGVV